MLEKWAKVVYHRAWYVLILVLILIGLSAVYGSNVFSRLSSGNDFQDPKAASTTVYNVSRDQFQATQAQLLVLFSNPHLTVQQPAFANPVTQDIARIRQQPHVLEVLSYYSSGDKHFVSNNQHYTFAEITLNGSTSQQQQVYTNLAHEFSSNNSPIQVRLGGNVAVNAQINQQITSDLKRAESLSFPIVAVLLILIFGNVVAAMVPLFLGGMSILGALFITRLLTDVTTLSAYVINVITLLGLGLAIDYSLFLVGRFREELNQGGDVESALTATVQKAGRTIMFSGSTVIISLLSLLVFPETFLRSMGMSGAAVVAAAVLLSVTIVPAALKILGKHINALSLPGRNKVVKHRVYNQGFWYRFSQFIMRRPVPVLLLTLALLLVVGSQFLHANLSSPDIYSTPTSLSSRQVNDILSQDFNETSTEPLNIIIHTVGSPVSTTNIASLEHYLARLQTLRGVQRSDSLLSHLPALPGGYGGVAMRSFLRSSAAAPLLQQYVSGSYEQLTVYQTYSPQSSQAQQLVKNIRAVSTPTGFTAYVGGVSAQLVDLLQSLRTHIPYALAIIFCATIVLIFLLMGGVLVPIKAIILGVLSLSAAFGVLVWVFQFHHLASTFSFAALGSIDATSAVLIFAIAFGLSMDYEFFLLSRIKEEYEASGDNTHAVAYGVQKTAGIITSAALLLISVIGLFTTSKISLIQQIGLGLGVAVAIDSTLVRMVLVPATMRLLGKANWWAPKPLRIVYKKFGLHD